MSFNPKNYQSTLGSHNDKDVIWISFPYDILLIEELKQVSQPKWSNSKKCWYLQDVTHYRDLFNILQKNYGKSILSNISDINKPAFLRYVEQLQLKGYSHQTIRTYSVAFAQLLKVLKSFPVNDLTEERLRSYFLYCVQKLRLSENQIHSRMNAIKFYFEQILHRSKFLWKFRDPKTEHFAQSLIGCRH